MAKLQFLSDEWFSEVTKLVEGAGDSGAPATGGVVMNLVVTDTPFDSDRQMHMGAKDGKALWGQGHVDTADVTLTTDYPTAKDVFIGGDPQAGMQAFMAGKIKVTGDMSKLMAMQGSGGPGGNPEVMQKIQEITE